MARGGRDRGRGPRGGKNAKGGRGGRGGRDDRRGGRPSARSAQAAPPQDLFEDDRLAEAPAFDDSPARGPLLVIGGGVLLLFMLTLTTGIAPMGIATGLLGLVTLLALIPGSRPEWPRTPVLWPMLAWLAAMAIASQFALDPQASWPRITKALMPLLVPVVAIQARDTRTGKRALAAYLVAAAAVAVFGLVDWALKGASFASRARGLSGHYMTFAGQLLLEIPVALAIAFNTRSRAWRLGAWAVVVVAALALAATFTRSAWLGLFGSSVVVLALLWLPGLVLLGVLAALVWWLAPGAWGERLHSVADPHNLWNQQRVYMWDAGVRMFRDHPLTGVGLQDLHALYDQYRSPEATERAGHLHNAYVQIAASMGVVGLAAFAWLYTSLLRTAWSTLGMWQDLTRRARANGLAAAVPIGVTASLVGFLIAGMFEWNFGDEELLYHLYALVGFAWAAGQWDADA